MESRYRTLIELIEPRYREKFCRLMTTGDLEDPDFQRYLETDKNAQEAVGLGIKIYSELFGEINQILGR